MRKATAERPQVNETDDFNYPSAPPALASALLYTVLALVASLLVWSSISTLDEITRGEGKIIPSSHAQIVQSLEGGIVQDILVKEGDKVTKGQILVRLSDVAFASEEQGTETNIYALKLKKARLEAESKGEDFVIPDKVSGESEKIAATEMDLYHSRQNELKNSLSMIEDKIANVTAQINEAESQMAKSSQSAALIKKELDITSRMVAQKALPQIEELRLQRELSEANGSYRISKDKKDGFLADLSTAKKQLIDQKDRFRTQALGELNETQVKLNDLEQNLKTIGDRVDRREIRSPVNGVINNIMVKTIGGVVEPAMKLAEIIPDDDELKVQAQIAPSDIAFLRLGQPARVKLTAYDSARYGYLDGKVSRVGANSLTNQSGAIYFEVEIVTDKNYLGTLEKPLPISSGMVAEVNIITGKKTVLEYLLKPVLRLKDHAFTER